MAAGLGLLAALTWLQAVFCMCACGRSCVQPDTLTQVATSLLQGNCFAAWASDVPAAAPAAAKNKLCVSGPESSPAASEQGGADAINLGAAGLKLEGLGRSRQQGKGFGGLNGLGFGPGTAAAAAGDSDSEDDEEAATATRFKGLPVSVTAKKQQRRQPQHQQQRGGFAAALDDYGDEGADVGRRGEGRSGLEGSSEEDTALVAQLLAKALAGKDDEDGDKDRWVGGCGCSLVHGSTVTGDEGCVQVG